MTMHADIPASFEAEKHGKEVFIDWQVSESLPTHFVNNITVQHTEHEFILTFYEVRRPVLLGPLAQEKLEQLESIPAVAVARIAVAAGRLPEFIEAMQSNLRKYYLTMGEGLEETDE
jgi:hypothetical protein